MEIEVKGLDNLLRKLEQLGEAPERVLNKVALDIGERMQAAAKENCPVDTGNLRASIVAASPVPGTVTVGTNVDYAAYVEYGTGPKGDPSVPHTTKKYWRFKDKDGNWITSHGQAPQPFLRPAVERYRGKIPEIVKKALEDELKGMS